MKRNSDLLYSLTHFDISANPQLGLDPQGTLVFIQEPQTIASLNLSKCGLNFDLVSTHTVHTLYMCMEEGDVISSVCPNKLNSIQAIRYNKVTHLSMVVCFYYSVGVSCTYQRLSTTSHGVKPLPKQTQVRLACVCVYIKLLALYTDTHNTVGHNLFIHVLQWCCTCIFCF